MKSLPLLLVALSCLPGVAQDIRQGLVAYWPMDEVSPDGLSTPDRSARQYHLTLVNFDASNVVTGMRSNALVFNGTNELAYTDTGGGLKPGLPLQGNVRKTVCLWIKANGASQNDRRFFAEASMASNAPMLNYGTDSSTAPASGKLDFFLRGDNNTAVVNHAKSAGEPMNGTWHHLAITDDNGTVRYYIDGVLDSATLTYTRPTMTLDTLSLGAIRRLSGNLAFFNGSLDDVAVWNRILSPAEIQQVMNSGLATPVPPLVLASRAGPYRQGDFVRFSIEYPGLDSATFQWRRNGTDIPGAVERTFAVTALSAATQGEYTVMLNGTTLSNVALLEFTPDPAPALTANIVSSWPFDVLNTDSFPAVTPDPWGGHPLSCNDMDGSSLVAGKFGSALEFDGISKIAYRTTGFPVTSAPEYSVALWVKADGTTQNDLRVFAEGSDATNTPLFAMGTANNGTNQLRLLIRSDSNTTVVAAQTEAPVFDDTWHHVVWTDRNGQGRLYVNGVMDGTNFNYNRAPLVFTMNQTSVGGIRRLAPSHWSRSTIDDVALWNRALTWTEVQALVAAAVPAPASAVAPDITVHPVPRTLWAGRTVSLAVQAVGTAPFTYQWLQNGVPVPDSNVPVLLLDPAEAADSGTYTCVVTNSAGSDTSDPAILVVRPINNLDSGRLSTWALDAGNATTPDSVSGHDFTVTNLDPLTAWQPGVKNNAVRMDGVDDLLVRTRTGTGSDLPLTTREEFTLSFWVRGVASGQSDRRIFAEGSAANNQPLFTLGTDSTGTTDRLTIFIRGDTGALPADHRPTNASVLDGYWHQVTYTDYRGRAQFYVDGIPDISFTYTRPVSTFNTISLGAIARAAASHWFTGKIDEVNTWERALSVTEAAAWYDAQPKPAPTLDVASLVPVGPGHLQMTVATSFGAAFYEVETTANLASGPWVPATDAVIGQPSFGSFSVDLYPTGGGRRFYRVKIP